MWTHPAAHAETAWASVPSVTVPAEASSVRGRLVVVQTSFYPRPPDKSRYPAEIRYVFDCCPSRRGSGNPPPLRSLVQSPPPLGPGKSLFPRKPSQGNNKVFQAAPKLMGGNHSFHLGNGVLFPRLHRRLQEKRGWTSSRLPSRLVSNLLLVSARAMS